MKINKPIYILGDVHGEYAALKRKIEYYDLRDCTLICVGDFGVGFYHPMKERALLRDLNSFFENRAIAFMSIRGNHDDPSFFKSTNGKPVYSHIEFLPDYSVKTINGEKFLFVGGAISVDRGLRVEGRSWWRDEVFVYDATRVTSCDVLITHSAPSWIGPYDKSGISGYCDRDARLWDDCCAERQEHEKLLCAALPKTHYCGHFHLFEQRELNIMGQRVVSTILDILDIREYHTP